MAEFFVNIFKAKTSSLHVKMSDILGLLGFSHHFLLTGIKKGLGSEQNKSNQTKAVFRTRNFRIRLEFNQVSGSGFRRGKNDPQK